MAAGATDGSARHRRGVTTEGQLAVLRDMGHRYLQGYVFSCPVEAGELAAGAWRTCAAASLAGAFASPAG